MHDDQKIDEMVERARLLVVESGKSLEVEAAREGAEIWLARPAKAAFVDRPNQRTRHPTCRRRSIRFKLRRSCLVV